MTPKELAELVFDFFAEKSTSRNQAVKDLAKMIRDSGYVPQTEKRPEKPKLVRCDKPDDPEWAVIRESGYVIIFNEVYDCMADAERDGWVFLDDEGDNP